MLLFIILIQVKLFKLIMEILFLKNFQNQNSFESLKSIISKVSKNYGIDRGLRELTFVKLWPDLIGPKFKDKTKVFSVSNKGNFDIVIISVSSSSVSQELLLLKDMILKKITSVSLSLKFNVKDIIFTTKHWDLEDKNDFLQQDSKSVTHFFKSNPTEKDLDNIKIPENIMESILLSVEKHNFTNIEIKERILKTISSDIKLQIWRKLNGFPSCEKCGITIDYYSEDIGFLCPSCKYKK